MAEPLLGREPASERSSTMHRVGSNFVDLGSLRGSFGGPATGTQNPLPARLQKENATNAWYEEYVMQEQVADFEEDQARRAPIFERYNKPHIFTDAERKRMKNFESIDYWEPQSLTYKEHIKERRQQRRWGKWIIYSAVGLAVGLWSVILFQSLDLFGDLKVDTVEGVINGVSNDIRKDPTWRQHHSDMGNGVPLAAIVRGYFVWILWCSMAAICASLCCVLMPTAAGSGVPEVMAFLNGVTLPRIFNLRTLFVKTLSCILAVNSGLPVGAEGPMIHCGALIGAGLPTGRSRSLKCSSGILTMFRNSKDHRDFVTAGSAAGVTAAFGSPIGGLLFVMEEIASFFPVKLAWMVFFSCLSCIFTMHLVNSFLKGWTVRDRDGMPVGGFKDSVLTLFNTDYAQERVSMDLLTFIPTIIIGLIMGAIAIFFTLGNIRVLRNRNKRINPNAILRVGEPTIFILFYATVSYFVPLMFSCKEIPEKLKTGDGRDIQFIGSFCQDPDKEFNPMATLTLTSAYNTIKILYTRYTTELIPWEALLVYQIMYTLGAMYCGGMFLSSGIVIPTLLIGAIGGRCLGVAINQGWADAGVIALIGSASFFGGLSRLTFSLVVIMMEITNDLTHIATLMAGAFIAKMVADRYSHSLYHAILEVKCVPYLDAAVKMHKLDTNTAKDIMTLNPTTVTSVIKVLKLVELLKTTSHNAFPVVSLADGRTLRGIIQRKQLETLLWFIKLEDEGHISSTNFNRVESGSRRQHATYKELQDVNELMFWERLKSLPELSSSAIDRNVDLNPYIDTSATFVHETMSVSKTYEVFRNMGLRHLPVINRSNHVTGIITRQNMMGDIIYERLKRPGFTAGDEIPAMLPTGQSSVVTHIASSEQISENC